MPFDRPSLLALVQRVRADMRGRLEIAGILVRRVMADVLSIVWAGAVHMLHGHLEWIARQLFPDTADREFVLRHAALYGISPVPASYASGNATATGTNDAVIPTGTIVVLEAGITYRVTADATIVAGEALVALTAVLAGAAANAVEGATLSFESPVTGVDTALTVAVDGISGGFDEESTAEVVARLLLRLREPPEGGADHDYEAWALAVAGVTRAWVYPNELGLGTVVVRFVLDGLPDIFPDAPTVAAVQAALAAKRPITAEVTAMAPTPLDVDFTLAVVPDTVAVHDAVTAELTDLLRREAAPGDGAALGTIKLSAIRTAIGVAEGLTDYTLTVPSADVVPAVGELAILGTITWA